MPLKQQLGNSRSVLIAVLLVMVISSAALTSAQTYVLNAAKFAAGHNPEGVAIADFNKDGNNDLAVANYNDDTVSILLGGPGGSLHASVEYPTGANPAAVVTGDFNKDGKLDVAVLNQNCPSLPCAGDGSVSILLGKGDGTFQAQLLTDVGEGPAAILVSDFNADGKLDLAVTNGQDNNVSILLGDGTGSFSRADVAASTNDQSITAGDFNGDGKIDLVAANKAKSNLSVLLGNGDGTFQTQTLVATGSFPVAIVSGDFNHDGKLDLATGNSGSSDISILLGNGDGTFQGHTEVAITNPALAVNAADLNGDGKLDLVATSVNTDSVSVLLGKGDGTFRPRVDYAAGAGPNTMAVGDVNGDNALDLVIAGSVENTILVLPGDGKGAFQSVRPMIAGSHPSAIATGDFNGDTKVDLAITNWTSSSVSILLGKGNGTFTAAPDTPAVGTKAGSIVSTDFNNDGKQDLAIANSGDGTVSILLGNADGSFQPQSIVTVRTKPSYLITGDFNSDRRPDLAVVNQISQNVSILLGNGDGTFQPAVSYTTGASTTPAGLAAGDFVGNGRLDLAVTGTGNNTVVVLMNHGDGTFTLPVSYSVGATPTAVTTGDFNHDGVVDLAVVNSKSNSVSILLGNGNGTFAPAVNFPTAVGPLSVVAEDLNGDGFTDLAVGFSGVITGADNGISVLIGNGDGTFQTHVDHATKFLQGATTEALASGDFNGDGGVDLVAADQLSNLVSVFLNTPLASLSPASLNFGTQLVGQPGPSKSVTLSNSGGAKLGVNSVVASAGYSQTNSCADSVDPGSSCTISVVFTPAGKGNKAGTVTVTDNSPSSLQVATLAGVGTFVDLNPTSLNFGSQQVGTTSGNKNVVMTNTGTAALTISGITLKGANAGDFTQSNNCGTSLAAGKSCTLRIKFAPTAQGNRSASVSISDDGGGSPQTVALTGTGS